MSRSQGLLSRFRSDRSGTIAVFTALSLTALVGFAGLGVETSQWYAEKRSVQAAADDAALSAAVAYSQGNTATYINEGKSVAGNNGFVDGVNNVSVGVSKPPASGPYANNNSAVQVIIVAPAKPILSAMFISDFNISASSVALVNAAANPNGDGNACVLALNSAAMGAATLSGTTSITLKHCSFAVNSKNTDALVMNGNAFLSAAYVLLGGADSVSNNATVVTTGGVLTNQPPVTDPYAGRTIPTPAASCINPGNIKGTVTLSAGTYCSFSINAGANVTLNPGVYILNRTDFDMAGNAAISGTGVTIILTSSGAASQTGNIIINGGATVNLTAPTSGPYSGMVFWQDGRAPDSNTDKFNGGSTMNITGVIYTPSESVTYNGGNTTGGTGCTQIVAKVITFTGNSEFDNNCSGVGVSSITGGTSLASLAQ